MAIYEYPGQDSSLEIVLDYDNQGNVTGAQLREVVREGLELFSIDIPDEQTAKRLKTWLERIQSN